MKSEYFLVLLFTIIVPLIMSFGKEIRIYKNPLRLILTLLIPFIIFSLIDIISVKRGLWTFNENYTTGIKIFNLPLEEVLFFAVIPFSCLFLWETVKYYAGRIKK